MYSDADIARFWAKVQKTDTCWLWTAGKTTHGYGWFWANGRNVYAHRFAWEVTNGPIPDDKFGLHTCDTPLCVRPDAEHVHLGTQSDNITECVARKRHPRLGKPGLTPKLTAEQVQEARRLYADGLGSGSIARIFNCRKTTIVAIIRGRTWKHLPVDPAIAAGIERMHQHWLTTKTPRSDAMLFAADRAARKAARIAREEGTVAA